MPYFTFPHTAYYDGDVGWMLRKMAKLLESDAQIKAWIERHEVEYQELKAYVENYFATLDLSQEVSDKLDQMVEDGDFDELLGGTLAALTTNRKGRRFIFVGDSYANRPGDWDDTLVARWGLNKCDLTAGEQWSSDTDCFFLRRGGFGFVGVSTSDPNIGGKWIDLVAQYWPAGVDKSTITDIVIVGGYNDRNESAETILNAMRDFAAWTRQFTNAQVRVIEAGFNTADRSIRLLCRQAYTAYSRAASIDSAWNYVAGCEGALSNTAHMIADDWHHPSPAGGQIMADIIGNALLGLPAPAQSTGYSAFTSSANGDFLGGQYCSSYDPARLVRDFEWIGTPRYRFATAIQPAGYGTPIELGTANAGLYAPAVTPTPTQRVPCIYYSGVNEDGNGLSYYCQLSGDEYGKLYVTIPAETPIASVRLISFLGGVSQSLFF